MVESCRPEPDIVVPRITQAAVDAMMAALQPTAPLQPQGPRFRTPGLLARVPAVRAAFQRAPRLWRRWKGAHALARWALTAAERQAGVTLQSVLVVALLFPRQLQRADKIASGYVTRALERWPGLNRPPGQMFQNIKNFISERIRPWEALVADGGYGMRRLAALLETRLSGVCEHLFAFQVFMLEFEKGDGFFRAARGHAGRRRRRRAPHPLLRVTSLCVLLLLGAAFRLLSRAPLPCRLVRPPPPPPRAPSTSSSSPVTQPEPADSS